MTQAAVTAVTRASDGLAGGERAAEWQRETRRRGGVERAIAEFPPRITRDAVKKWAALVARAGAAFGGEGTLRTSTALAPFTTAANGIRAELHRRRRDARRDVGACGASDVGAPSVRASARRSRFASTICCWRDRTRSWTSSNGRRGRRAFTPIKRSRRWRCSRGTTRAEGEHYLKRQRHRGFVIGLTKVREVRVPKGVVGMISPWNYPLLPRRRRRACRPFWRATPW